MQVILYMLFVAFVSVVAVGETIDVVDVREVKQYNEQHEALSGEWILRADSSDFYIVHSYDYGRCEVYSSWEDGHPKCEYTVKSLGADGSFIIESRSTYYDSVSEIHVVQGEGGDTIWLNNQLYRRK